VLIEATQEILFAKLYLSDGVFNNMEAIRKIIEKKGLFYALYVRESLDSLKLLAMGGFHVNVASEQKALQQYRYYSYPSSFPSS
jgi:hypothetical protein